MTLQIVAGYVAIFLAGGIAVTVVALLYADHKKNIALNPVESFDDWLDRQW